MEKKKKKTYFQFISLHIVGGTNYIFHWNIQSTRHICIYANNKIVSCYITGEEEQTSAKPNSFYLIAICK